MGGIIDLSRWARIEHLPVTAEAGNLEQGLSALARIAYAVNGEVSPKPECVPDRIRAFVEALGNKNWATPFRQQLGALSFAQRLVAARRGLPTEIYRSYLAADWSFRVVLPRALDCIGKGGLVRQVAAGLEPVRDEVSSAAVMRAAKALAEQVFLAQMEDPLAVPYSARVNVYAAVDAAVRTVASAAGRRAELSCAATCAQHAALAWQLAGVLPGLEFEAAKQAALSEQSRKEHEGLWADCMTLLLALADADGKALLDRRARPSEGGLLAGTLVHTAQGLVPIEQIRVGDMVVSKPELRGCIANCPVTGVYVRPHQPITLIRYCRSAADDIDCIGLTADLSLWVDEYGWTRAERCGTGSVVALKEEPEATTLCARPVFGTASAAWVESAWGIDSNDRSGNRLEIQDGNILVGEKSVYATEIIGDENLDPTFRATVYNLEIEGSRTFYVGRLGVWICP